MQKSLQKVRDSQELTKAQVATIILEQAEQLTGSRMSYFAVLTDDHRELTMIAWSRAAMAECRMREVPLKYPLAATGLWGDCVRERQPVIVNDYEQCTRVTKKGTPDGHAPVLRHLNVPIREDGRIVGILGVGNKETPYTAADAKLLQEFANASWPTVAQARVGEP